MLSSRMFYQDDLVPGDGTPTDSLCQWPHLPTRGCPIIFEGVQGLDEREGSSPSWFNATEARKVREECSWCFLSRRGGTLQGDEQPAKRPMKEEE
jgi:helicase MOV-10